MAENDKQVKGVTGATSVAYRSGLFAGIPGRRGYFWGVGDSLSIITKCRSSANSARSTRFTSRRLPPNMEIALFARLISSLVSPFF